MATTFTPRLNLAKQANADNIGAWEIPLNLGFDDADSRLFRTGVVTPIGAGSPDEDVDYVGQRYLDTVTELWYTGTAIGTPGTYVQSEVGQLNNSVQSMEAGLAAALPTPSAATAGSIFIETDTKKIKRDTGTVYEELGPIDLIVLPFMYLAGLNISPGSVPTTDIDIAVGSCRTADDLQDAKRSSVMVKELDNIWAAGTAAGGLFTGAVAADTWYHVFLIVKDSDLTVDAGFDTDIAALNIPAGYTSQRRIGSIRTEPGSTNIRPFNQTNDRFDFVIGVENTYTVDDSAGGDTITLDGLPPGVKVKAYGWVDFNQTGGKEEWWVKSMDQDASIEPVTDDASHRVNQPLSGVAHSHGEWGCYSDTAQAVRARRDVGSGVNDFIVMGYDDFRGKDGQGAI